MTKLISLGSLFDAASIDKAHAIMATTRVTSERVARLEKEVVLLRLDHIDFVTGQENHPPYLAWMLLHHIMASRNEKSDDLT